MTAGLHEQVDHAGYAVVYPLPAERTCDELSAAPAWHERRGG